MSDIAIIRTGTANLASVSAAFDRCCASWDITEAADDVARAARVVLPGVGAFGSVMQRLAAMGLVEAIRSRILAGRPTLCICLGLQVLFEGSDETPGARGLAVLPGRFTAFESVRRPQFGWNEVTPDPGCTMLQPGAAYFANSYGLVEAPAGWSAARAEHGGSFIAAIERGPVLACQFHPELSGAWGLALLRRWLEVAC